MNLGGKMTVTASVPIKKNKPIKFNYVKVSFILVLFWYSQDRMEKNIRYFFNTLFDK